MTRWRKTVDIKPLLTEDLDDVGAMQNVRNLLGQHSEFVNVLDDMDDAISSGDGELFNQVLADVYDIADAERIWMGP
jgi:hypothetical protein